MINALTVDIEDWYHGAMPLNRAVGRWDGWESRILLNTNRLLDIFAEKKVKATFFIVGYLAERFPEVVERIKSAGHDIGTHGYLHQPAHEFDSQQAFAEDLKKSIEVIEGITGEKVDSHRATNCSITGKSWWALDILMEQGIKYDSSIFPISGRNSLYGMPESNRYPYIVKKKGDRDLIEFPITTLRKFSMNIPITGGFYLRSLPYLLTQYAIKKINEEGKPAMVYLHPWELDPGHPKISLPLHWKFYQYYNLETTESKIRKLLSRFEFSPMTDVLRRLKLS